MKAMILAAGFGTRLHPYSLLRPKPLFPLLNAPLLLQTIEHLQTDGFSEIGVNCHHLAPQIITLLQKLEGVHIFHEEMVLGTGGGLKNAEDWFAGAPVLVTNADIYHDINFAEIMQYHIQQQNLATLVCHDYPRFNKVSLGGGASVQQFSPCGDAESIVAFTGVHVLDPRVLSAVSVGFSSIVDCYKYWIGQEGRVQAKVVQGHFWMDMGTPADYLELHRILLNKRSSPFLIHPSVDTTQASFTDWVSIGEGVVLGDGCHLERVIVWDGAVVEPNTYLKDTIVT